MIGADLNNIDLTNNHLDRRILTYLSLSGVQLFTAETYNRAILLNGTIALYANFIRNADAIDCTLEHCNKRFD